MSAGQIKVGSALDLVQNFLDEIRGSEKKAETGDGSDPTSLPYKSVDNHTQKGTMGARAAENREDVKKMLGSAGVIGQEDANSAPNTSEKTQSGGMKRLTADDHAPQTVNDNPPKPGDGKGPGDSTYSDRKYASLRDKAAELLNRFGIEEAVANTDNQSVELQKRAAASKYREDAEAGYVAAHLLATQVAEALHKQAAAPEEDAIALEKLAVVCSTAEQDASMFVDFMRGHLDGLNKQAELNPESGHRPDPEPEPESAPVYKDDDASSEAGETPLGDDGAEAKLEAIAAALEEAGITPEELAEAIAAVEQAQSGGSVMPSGAGASPVPGM